MLHHQFLSVSGQHAQPQCDSKLRPATRNVITTPSKCSQTARALFSSSLHSTASSNVNAMRTLLYGVTLIQKGLVPVILILVIRQRHIEGRLNENVMGVLASYEELPILLLVVCR